MTNEPDVCYKLRSRNSFRQAGSSSSSSTVITAVDLVPIVKTCNENCSTGKAEVFIANRTDNTVTTDVNYKIYGVYSSGSRTSNPIYTGTWTNLRIPGLGQSEPKEVTVTYNPNYNSYLLLIEPATLPECEVAIDESNHSVDPASNNYAILANSKSCNQNILEAKDGYGVVTVTTRPSVNNYSPTLCSASSSSPDAVITFKPDQGGTWRFIVTEAEYDPVLYIRTDAGPNGTDLACNDDAESPFDGLGNRSAIELSGVNANTVYYLIVDGWSNGPGKFTLHAIKQ